MLGSTDVYNRTSMDSLHLGNGHPCHPCLIHLLCCTHRTTLCDYPMTRLQLHPPRLSTIHRQRRPKGENGEYCLTFYAGSCFWVCCQVVSASWSADRPRVASDETLTSSTVLSGQPTLEEAYIRDADEVQPHEWKQYGYWACPSVDGVPCSNSRTLMSHFFSLTGQ